MAEVYLVRHGATQWSVSGQHTGRTDLPLLPEGEAQARALAPRLADLTFDLVLTSPLQRAWRTAELAGYPDAEQVEDLMEWDYGDYEGLTKADIFQTCPGWSVWNGPWTSGDSPTTVATRLLRVSRRVQAVQPSDGSERPGRVLFFAHGHILRSFTGLWLGLSVRGGRHFTLDTATMSVLGWDRERPVVARWNS
ncbi:MAG: histidine phosphatase family protein [Nocardioides sp.]